MVTTDGRAVQLSCGDFLHFSSSPKKSMLSLAASIFDPFLDSSKKILTCCGHLPTFQTLKDGLTLSVTKKLIHSVPS
eukprot:4255461-Amphidinium_carterae.1